MIQKADLCSIWKYSLERNFRCTFFFTSLRLNLSKANLMNVFSSLNFFSIFFLPVWEWNRFVWARPVSRPTEEEISPPRARHPLLKVETKINQHQLLTTSKGERCFLKWRSQRPISWFLLVRIQASVFKQFSAIFRVSSLWLPGCVGADSDERACREKR